MYGRNIRKGLYYLWRKKNYHMDNKFLDKVIEQIISETRVIDNKLYTPFLSPLFSFSLSSSLSSSLLLSSFISHCKEVYSLNEQEIDYVWEKYKKGLTALINDKEPAHQEKGWWFITHDHNNIYGEYTNE